MAVLAEKPTGLAAIPVPVFALVRISVPNMFANTVRFVISIGAIILYFLQICVCHFLFLQFRVLRTYTPVRTLHVATARIVHVAGHVSREVVVVDVRL